VFRNADNALVALMSGGAGAWGGAQDTFTTDLPAYKLRIEAMVAQLETTVIGGEVGWDRRGGDLPSGSPLTTADAPACLAACQANVNCHAASWRSADRQCYLKSFAANPTPRDNTVSFVLDAFNQWGAFDLPGNDIPSSPWKGGSNECTQQCLITPGCKGATFIETKHECWLKAALSTPSTTTACARANDCHSFMRRGSESADRSGGDVRKETNIADDATCALHCSQEQECQAYSYTGNKNCYLKKPVPNPTAATGTRSAVRRGIVYNRMLTGSPYRSVSLSIPSGTVCSNQCTNDAQCVAWSLRTTMSQGMSNTCQLFASTSPSTFEGGAMFGFKSLDFLP
jgi:hypothetical protein